MYIESTSQLRDPNTNHLLELEVFEQSSDGHVMSGILRAVGTSDWYPVINGVPVFLTGDLRPDFTKFAEEHDLAIVKSAAKENHQEQRITNETFSDKWRRFQEYGLSSEHQEFLYDWYCKKFGVDTVNQLKSIYKNKRRILEVGPGSGFNSKFMAENSEGEVFALDISEAAFTTFKNTKHLGNCNVVQADLFDAPFENGTFDLIVADGVLHHTPNTKTAVFRLFEKLAPGGQFFFYIYRKMGAARYFCDQHIRDSFMSLSPEECYKECEPITELGKALSDLNATITLEKPIDILGIPAGTHDVQRLFYYNFLKCFWNDAFDYETNNMVNFDWYHPHNAWQHTEEEVVGWMEELGVTKFEFNDSNPNGISCFLTK